MSKQSKKNERGQKRTKDDASTNYTNDQPEKCEIMSNQSPEASATAQLAAQLTGVPDLARTNTSCVWRAILPITSAIHDATKLYLPWLSKHTTISGYATNTYRKPISNTSVGKIFNRRH
ncbi:hypothetical protein DPMN_091378 [Dreissena polymorpha]|uniref:Uncharacterized protein n=1 Tax=Dreissena polymorpha TaxID=45954 RepID=A0A9D4KZF4_DREPO|nr:hypothetical protein DPMN_091378 [Dreissena polymorpha]